MSSIRLTVAAIFVAALLVCAPSLAANEDAAVARLAEAIATLRGEVDSEEQELQRERRKSDSETAALTAELEELKLQADRAEARSRSLRSVIREREAELRGRADARDDLRQPVLGACRTVRESIAKSSPLRRDERLSRVDDLESRLRSRAVTPGAALDELANIVRDEIELTGTTQLTKEVVAIDGEERLVPVVALGTALMYWQLDDGRTGFVAHSDGKWTSKSIDSEAGREAVETLYQAERTATQSVIVDLPLSPASAQQPPDSNSEGP
jgi:hypothetical protein